MSGAALLTTAASTDSLPLSLNDYIYTDVVAAPCVRLLNATGVIGCQALPVSAPLYIVNTVADIAEFVQTSPETPWAVLIPPVLLTKPNLDALYASGKLAGVVVTSSPPAHYSSASTRPNGAFTLYASDPDATVWNPRGNSIEFNSFDFPIFRLVNGSSQDAVIAAAEQNRQTNYRTYPLNAVELDSYMWAITNSETCLRRGHCDPVGGNSVWGTVQPLQANSLIVVSAKLDASAFFRDLALGAAGDTAAVVAVLACADAITKLDVASFNKNILFALFDAEAWDFSGSQRFVQEILTFNCETFSDDNTCAEPRKKDLTFKQVPFANIDAYIELSQVGGIGYTSGSTAGVLFAHIDNLNNNTLTLAQTVFDVSSGTNYSQEYDQDFLSSAPPNLRLPPASLQSFIQARPLLAGIVITDFESEFSTPYYHSEFDILSQLSDKNLGIICDAATLAARSAYALANAGHPIPPSLVANCTLVTELMTCLLANFTCPIVAKYLPNQNILQPSHYTGVYRYGSYSSLSKFVHDYLGDILSLDRNDTCDSSDSCPTDMSCIGSTCLLTHIHFHDAYGMGLSYSSSEDKYFVSNASRPAWTESQWMYTRMRLFSTASFSNELGQFFGGVGVAILAVLATYFGRRYIAATVPLE